MSGRLTLAACLVGAVLSLSLHAQDQPADGRRQPFRSGAHYVRVDAYPAENGRPLQGLTAEDFELLEDGRPQAIDSVEYIEHPAWTPLADRRDPDSQRAGMELARDPGYRVFVVYLDAFHVDFSGSHRASRPVAELLNRMMGPRDLFGLLTPAQSPKDLLLGQLTQTIEEQLTELPMWGLAGRIASQPGEAELEFLFPEGVRLVALRRLDKVYGDLEGLVDLLGNLRDARKNIIYFSDALASPSTRFRDIAVDPDPRARGNPPGVGVNRHGTLTTGSRNEADPDGVRLNAERSRLLSIDFDQRFRELVQRARHANVAFYTVRPGGLDAGSSLMNDATANLQVLAEQTDGLAVLGSNDLRAGVAKIAEDLSSHYVLGYYTNNTRWDGRTRKITVRLKPSGRTVRARREYRAPTEDEMASIRDARAAAAAPAAPSAADVALTALARLGAVPAFEAYATHLGDRLAVVAEIGAAQIEAGRWKKGAEVEVLLSGPDGAVHRAAGRIEAGARGTLVTVPIAAPGTWRAVVNIRGEDGVESDTINSEAEGGTLFGRPIAYRAASAAVAPFHPASIFHFRRTERVRLDWPIRQDVAAPAARLLDRNENPLPVPVAVSTRDVDGQPVISTELSLAPLSIGDYLVEISGQAGAASDRQLFAIRVTMAR